MSNLTTAMVMGWAAHPQYPIVALGIVLRLPSHSLDDTATQEMDVLKGG